MANMKKSFPHANPIYQIVNATNGSHVQDIVQQVFIGEYEQLSDTLLNPWPIFERVRLERFVGRDWLVREFDEFLNQHDRGYFILEAGSGLGKTTFLAWLVKQRGYLYNFCELTPGLDNVGRAIKNLATQLIVTYNIDVWKTVGVLPSVASSPDFLLNILQQAVEKVKEGNRIVIVIDALDEAGSPNNLNILGLPKALPKGVYILASQRPVETALIVDTASTPRRIFRLLAENEDNLADIRQFLEKTIARKGISSALQDNLLGYSQELFISTLLDKSRGNWVYLHYIIDEIEKGKRSIINLEELPVGVTQYFFEYWARERCKDENKWYKNNLPIIAVLAAAQEAVTIEQIIGWANIQAVSKQIITRQLNEHWRPFLAVIGSGERALYRLHHTSLREFFYGQVDRSTLLESEISFVDELSQAVCKAHNQIAEKYLTAWGGVDAGLPGLQKPELRAIDGGYGLRHLTAHLVDAGRVRDLYDLLCLERLIESPKGIKHDKNFEFRYSNVWFEARDSEGQIDGYLIDVDRLWKLSILKLINSTSETLNTFFKDAGFCIGLQVRCALLRVSINNLSSGIPPELFNELIKHGVWNMSHALNYAHQITDPFLKVRVLSLLIPQLPESQHTNILNEALHALKKLENPFECSQALASLIPLLSEPMRTKALEEALTAQDMLRDNFNSVIAIAALAPYLSGSQRFMKLAIAEHSVSTLDDEYYYTLAMAALIPVEKNERASRINKALKAAHKIVHTGDRIWAMMDLLPYLDMAERNNLIKQALNLMSTPYFISDFNLSLILTKLVPYLPEAQCIRVLDEAMFIARKINDKDICCLTQTVLGPHLKEVLLPKILEIEGMIENTNCLFCSLTTLIPHLPKETRIQEVKKAISVAHRFTSDKEVFALIKLIPFLTEDQRDQIIVEIKSHLRNLTNEEFVDEVDIVRVLIELIPYLPEIERKPVANYALITTRKIARTDLRAQALAKLAQYFPKKQRVVLLKEALVEVQNMGKETVLQIPFILSNSDFINLDGVTIEELRATTLTIILPHLPIEQQDQVLYEALITAYKIKDKRVRIRHLSKLSRYLRGDRRASLVLEIINEACSIDKLSERNAVLANLVPSLETLPPNQLLILLQETLFILATRNREDLLYDLCKLEPLIFMIGGETAINETFHAIIDIQRWWP